MLFMQHWGIVLRMDGNLHYDTQNIDDGVDHTLESIEHFRGQKSLIFVNPVDFDMIYGYRRNKEIIYE